MTVGHEHRLVGEPSCHDCGLVVVERPDLVQHFLNHMVDIGRALGGGVEHRADIGMGAVGEGDGR